MSMPQKLFRKLQETLGDEAADAMADWMGQVSGRNDELRADLADFRHEVGVKFADLREEMRVGLARVDARFAAAEAAVAQRHADMLKWMFGMWITSLVTIVATIVGLARALR